MKSWRTITALIVAVAVCIAGFAFKGVSFADEMSRDKDIVANLERIKNKENPFTIKIWTEKNKESYKLGEKVTFFFATDQDCYVYIIDVGTSGKAHVLFPNKWQKANKAQKGKVYTIPPEASRIAFKVKGPAGTNYTKVIASPKRLDALTKEGAATDEAFAELLNPTETVKDMEAELTKSQDWAEAAIAIKVAQ